MVSVKLQGERKECEHVLNVLARRYSFNLDIYTVGNYDKVCDTLSISLDIDGQFRKKDRKKRRIKLKRQKARKAQKDE